MEIVIFSLCFQLNSNLPINLEVISVNAINVYEGNKSPISSRNIVMVLDIAKYRIKESEVIFVILNLPLRGILSMNKVPLKVKSTFTLQDVNQEKVNKNKFFLK